MPEMRVPPSGPPSSADPEDRNPSAPEGHRAALAMTAVPLVIAAAMTLVLLAFGLPAVKGSPHNLPLGLAGPAAQTSEVAQALQDRRPGAFDLMTYSSRPDLIQAIRDRGVYGGILMSASGPQVLTASVASPVVAQSLTALGTELAAQRGGGAQPQVTDVVALPAADPRGAGIAASLLPIVAGTIAPGAALGRLTRRRAPQLVGLLIASIAAGFAYAAVLHFTLGTLSGNYLGESAVFAGALAAGGLVLLGLYRVAGVAGLGLGAAVILLLGNPLSGASTAPEFFKPLWRSIGQGITPGATIQLLRSVSFFDGAGMTGPVLVLGGWAAAGLVLLALPARSSGRRTMEATA